MRTPLVIVAGTLLVACASGTRVVYVPVPASTSVQAPAPAAPPPARVIPAPMPPVGVTIVRVDDNQMLVSTNQPAYLAVFEIVPNRGVTLVYPASAQQRQVPLAGSSWLNVSWRSARGLTDYDDREMRGRRQRPPMHHVYVVASERPLRLTASAFDDRTLAAMLGARLTQAADPYETMAALSRRFVPPGKDEDWGEDVYTMDIARPVTTMRVAKIYCPDGSVVYARDEMADRTACPWHSQGRSAPAPRPDSVVASNGRRMPRPVEPGPTRVFRVPMPANVPDTRPANGGDVADGRPGNGNGTGAANGNGGRDANDESARGRENPKGNNGNHYGWGNGNGNDGKDKNPGGTVANGGNANANDGKDKGNNGNHYGQEKNGNNGSNGSNANNGNGNNANNGSGNNQAEIQQQGKPERPSHAQPTEPKPAEVKPDPKPAAEPAVKDEPKPKQEEKPEAKQEPKQENKGIRGMMDRMRAKADSADAKDKKGKPDRD